MMSDFGDNASLADVTNKLASTNVNARDEAVIGRVKEANWSAPEKFNYDSYNADSKEKREAVEAAQDVPAWAANAIKYEWSDEYGDVGPEFIELEGILFGDVHQVKAGDQINKLLEVSVTVESQKKVKPIAKFEDAGLHPVMLKNVKLCGYQVPTPIQAYVLPSVFNNTDVIGIAQTGSGKTAAYLIPTISKLMGKAKKLCAARPNLTRGWTREDGVRAEPLILVVTPTRELATQIFDEARRLCYRSMLRPCVVYGGAPTGEQMNELRKGCDVLIATPGRLQDFLSRAALLSLSRVKYTIIDEADEMVTPDWADDMKNIMGGDSNDDDDHMYLMFSATFPKEARAVAREYMAKDHVRIRVGRTGSTHTNVMQRVLFVDEPKKRDCLFDLLLSMPPARTIIFVNNKKAADFIDDFLYNRDLPSTSIHSDRTQREREDALRAFKIGKAPILVATGVSARGLDIKNVMHVINYDMPGTDYGGINEYIHRIGRTARIGNQGIATSFYNDRNEDIGEALTRILIESGCDVPDFLEQYKPAEETKLEFDDDTDEEAENGENGDANGANGDSAWGADADTSGGVGWS